MISSQLSKLAKQLDWTVREKDGLIFGIYNDYQFSVLDGNGFLAYIVPVAGIVPAALADVLHYLESNRKSLRLLNFSASDNFLCIRVKKGLLPVSAARIEAALGHFSGILAMNQVPFDRCLFCGERAEARGLYLGLYSTMHEDCQQSEMVDYTGQAQDEFVDVILPTEDGELEDDA